MTAHFATGDVVEVNNSALIRRRLPHNIQHIFTVRRWRDKRINVVYMESNMDCRGCRGVCEPQRPTWRAGDGGVSPAHGDLTTPGHASVIALRAHHTAARGGKKHSQLWLSPLTGESAMAVSSHAPNGTCIRDGEWQWDCGLTRKFLQKTVTRFLTHGFCYCLPRWRRPC